MSELESAPTPRIDEGLAFLLRFENVAWYEDGVVRILDRRLYPIERRFVTCTTHGQVAEAIRDMVTQSAGPYLAASMGMVLAAHESLLLPEHEHARFMRAAAYRLSHARPTTSDRMGNIVNGSLQAVAAAERDASVEAAMVYALAEVSERYTKIHRMSELLAAKFPTGGTIMTQCFAETILGMMLRAARRQGNDVKVICPETRPYLQGARLTSSVVKDMGFDVSVITDNMPFHIMKTTDVGLFTSAADVICMDGHVVNKVGTSQIALCANTLGIPYLVTGIPNRAHADATSVQIEERDPKHVLEFMGTRTTVDGVGAHYPAFDITPPSMVNGVVTDKGVFSAFDLDHYYS